MQREREREGERKRERERERERAGRIKSRDLENFVGGKIAIRAFLKKRRNK